MEIVAFRTMNQPAVSLYHPINIQAVFLRDTKDFFDLFAEVYHRNTDSFVCFPSTTSYDASSFSEIEAFPFLFQFFHHKRKNKWGANKRYFLFCFFMIFQPA